MNKLKIYLDTSVISHLAQEDAPEKRADTQKLWEDMKAGKYDVYLSDTTLAEIGRCSAAKYEILTDYLGDIIYTRLSINDESREVAELLISLRILTAKSYDDCIHIAIAVVSGCDIIVSWNFRHIVNIKTIGGVRAISNLRNYKAIDIMQPTLLVQGEEA